MTRARLARMAAVLGALGVALGGTTGAGAEAPDKSGVSAIASPVAAAPATEKEAAGDEEGAMARPMAQRLGLDLSSEAPLEIDSRLIDIVETPDGGEKLKFTGNVRLTQGTLELTCEVLDAFYPEDAQGAPQRIVAAGDVQVRQNDVELRCERAEFDDTSCVTICESSVACDSAEWPARPARLKRGTDVIEGRQLEFNLCTGNLSARCGARIVTGGSPRAASSAP